MAKRVKVCTAPGCVNDKKPSVPFCMECFSELPYDLRGALSRARTIGDGKLLIESLSNARAMLHNINRRKRAEKSKPPEKRIVYMPYKD